MKRALFNTFDGRFSEDPRVIFEELVRRNGDIESTWAASDSSLFPANVKTVPPKSAEYASAFSQADLLIVNTWSLGQKKAPGSFYLQTWHGTPLKRIAFDNHFYFDTRPDELAIREADVAQWDLLISPSAFATKALRSAFAYEGEVLESGYPHNDVLNSLRAMEIATRVKNAFGIDGSKRVVLYTPTWRDSAHAKIELDIESAQRALGDDHVLLLRLHSNIATSEGMLFNDFAHDASSYPNVAELFLAADVLITDYSSTMFDFAVTGKPIIYFTYDLEHYRDEMRGFYFDFEAEAPGPLLRTSDDVIEALQQLSEVQTSYTGRYEAFQKKFCPNDDGHATDRVVERLSSVLC